MTDTKLPSFTPLVESLPSTIPFVGPEAIERRRNETFKVRVGANESAFGVSPKAAAAMRDAVENIAWYGDPEGYDLRTAIAAHHGVEMDEVCLGGGIDELLGLTVRMLAQPGSPVLTSLGAYPTFNYHVAGFGAELIRVPYKNDHIDLDALLEAAKRHKPVLVFFANPDNPMGTWHDAKTVKAFMDDLPEETVLIYDEAYIEFARPNSTCRSILLILASSVCVPSRRHTAWPGPAWVMRLRTKRSSAAITRYATIWDEPDIAGRRAGFVARHELCSQWSTKLTKVAVSITPWLHLWAWRQFRPLPTLSPSTSVTATARELCSKRWRHAACCAYACCRADGPVHTGERWIAAGARCVS